MIFPSSPWRLAAVAALAAAALACSSPAADVGDPNVCTDVGFCDDTVDVCTCDTTCTRLTTTVYSCESSCQTDADCAALTRPVSGEKLTTCVKTEDFGNQSAKGYCR